MKSVIRTLELENRKKQATIWMRSVLERIQLCIIIFVGHVSENFERLALEMFGNLQPRKEWSFYGKKRCWERRQKKMGFCL